MIEKLYKEYISLRNVRPEILEEVYKSFLVLTSPIVDLNDVSFLLENELEVEVSKDDIEQLRKSLTRRLALSETANKLIEKFLAREQYKKALAVLSCELLKAGYMLFPSAHGFQAVKHIHELINSEVTAHAR